MAFLFKYRGAVLVAPIRVRHPLRSAAALFHSRWFVVGWLIAILAWVLHAGALSRAPLSIVQAVLSGGLVFLAVLAERFFGFRLGRWQWRGVMITAARAGSHRTHQRRGDPAAALVTGDLLPPSRHAPRRGAAARPGRRGLFGVSDVAIKYLTHAQGPLYGLLSPWTATALVAGTIAFYASARSLQLGPGVEVIAFTSVVANLAAIIGGILVFGEPVGSGPLAIGARFVAFCMVIVGAALMPSQHAEQREPDTSTPPIKGTA